MKRLVWLLITVFVTASAQVQPVDLPLTKSESCGCCEDQAGACGMPDCAPAPVSCPTSPTLPTVTAQRAEARNLSPAPRIGRESYFVKFESRPALVPARDASLTGASAASVPLFKAHCSFLI
jgi:hypothetical protein